MNNMRNRIQLIGHLGKDPEIKTFESGKSLARLTIATTESYKNQKGELIKNTTWHNVVAWNKTAERMKKYLKKGNEVLLQGKLSHRSWENQNGETKYITEIIVNEFMLIPKVPAAVVAN